MRKINIRTNLMISAGVNSAATVKLRQISAILKALILL